MSDPVVTGEAGAGVVSKGTIVAEPIYDILNTKPNDIPVHMIPRELIKTEEGRGRKDFGDLKAMATSIAEVGLLQPLIVKPQPDGTYTLLAGERRLRTLTMMCWDLIPCHFREEANKLLMKKIEWYENRDRKAMDWQEEAELIRQIDDEKRLLYGAAFSGSPEGWSQAMTAELLGISQPQVSKQIAVAKTLNARPDLRKAIEGLDMTAAIRKIEQIQTTEHLETKHESGDLVILGDIINGDATVLIRNTPSGTVDLVVTDPPFGLEAIEESRGEARGANLSYTAFLSESDNATLEQAKALIDNLSPELFRVMKPSGHLYMFCSFTILPAWVASLTKAGFLVEPQPLIWYKGKSTTGFTGLSYPSCYEPIIFAHRPPREKHLTNPKSKNVLEYSPTHASKKIHRFQKPAELIEELVKNSSKIGDMVLDPFAGSGMTIKIAKELKRSALGFELDQKNWIRAQAFISGGLDILPDNMSEQE